MVKGEQTEGVRAHRGRRLIDQTVTVNARRDNATIIPACQFPFRRFGHLITRHVLLLCASRVHPYIRLLWLPTYCQRASVTCMTNSRATTSGKGSEIWWLM